MHKVICEEPRHGGGRSKQNRRTNLPDELMPKFEGIKCAHTNHKSFGEHLGPLKRWLRSQVGRPWNDVYSEACCVIKSDSVVRADIKTHLLDFVLRNTFMRDDEIWCFQTYRCSGTSESPVTTLRDRWHLFYVHPKTGFLREIPALPSRSRRYEERKRALASVCRWLNDGRLLLQLGGLWFECETQAWDDSPEGPPFDAAFKLRLGESHAREAYHKAVYCVRKRQLSRKELRRYGLKNARNGAANDFVSSIDDDFLRRVRGANGNPVRRSLRFGIYARIEASAEAKENGDAQV